MEIVLSTLSLVRYDNEYSDLKEEFENGSSKSPYIDSIGVRLANSSSRKDVFQSAFVVLDDGVAVGYVFISSMIKDEVFLEYAVLREFRGMGIATRIVDEVSEYLFSSLNIKTVKLDIAPSNEASIRTARKCGFFEDEDDFEERNFSGKIKFVKESYCYLCRRGKK